MINTEIIKIPAFTLREFLNQGVHKSHTLYDYKFTPNDRQLLNNGSLKLFPLNMYDFSVNVAKTLNGKTYNTGESIDVSEFDNTTLTTLLKTGMVRGKLKEEYAKMDVMSLIRLALIDECKGKTFEEISNLLVLDKALLNEKLELKDDFTKKATPKKMEVLRELI